eukprot:GGOE01038236.1.p1 GENE.GGOE01038236.1~~GGOE01038236.1.p1  ORF type:complete len:229 (+),score=41.80 GGOE01038236.1:33-689(+)
MAAVLGHVVSHHLLPNASSTTLCSLLWGCAKLRWVDPIFLASLADAVRHGGAIANMKASQAVNSLWALVHLPVDPAVADAIASHLGVVACLPGTLRPSQVMWAAWSLARHDLFTSSCLPALVFHTRAPGFLEACNPHEVAVLMWAFARLEVMDRQLLTQLVERALRPSVLTKCRPNDMAMLKGGLLDLGNRHPAVWKHLMNQSAMAGAVRHWFEGGRD